MRVIFIFLISILYLSVNAQVDTTKTKFRSRAGIKSYSDVSDTIPSVKYVQDTGLQPAFYINGEFSTSPINSVVDFKLIDIDSLSVEKVEIEIENKKYGLHIFFKTKDEYTPKLISLTNLAAKYTNLKDEPTIFMLNNEIIKGSYDQYLVDEKYILQIVVNTIEMEKENINVIRLLTRTDENIEKSRRIIIRGSNEITLN